MSKIALIFPGIGYNTDKPLLHYAEQLVKKLGYEIKEVNYSGFPEKVCGDADKMQECFDIALSQSEDILKDVDFNSYEEILIIAKSVGTAVAGAYSNAHKLSVRAILLTPVAQTFKADFDDAIVFHGNSDPWAVTQNIKDICGERDIEVNIIDDANHSLETGDALIDTRNMTNILKRCEVYITKTDYPNLKQAVNPYLPSWEYIPDGEPYVFGDRVYIYGSHDMFNGDVYCMLEYVCYSAPVDDLGNWRYEGVIFKKAQDPDNGDEAGMLYAPDVQQGFDGRYYLYYAVNNRNHISVAVCDNPGGKYEFYGYVHYQDGTRLGDLPEDEMQFDPGVLCEDGKVYLYTGFCPIGEKRRHGAMMTVLDSDMITIIEKPVFIAPSEQYSANDENLSAYEEAVKTGSVYPATYTGEKGFGRTFEGHEFFEAPSIRKVKGKYVFIYSSRLFHELCYAVADNPAGPFEYKGVIISNGDLHIDTYKDAEKCAYYCANNHGSLTKIKDDYYIFYHRHTNGTNYSRQECMEKLAVEEDATIHQAMMTSCCSIAPLKAEGVYPTYIACNLFNDEDITYIPWIGWLKPECPIISQDGQDGDMNYGYVTSMYDNATAGFKFFDFKGVKEIVMHTKGYGDGVLEIRIENGGEVVGSCPIENTSTWVKRIAKVNIPDGIHELYITFRGGSCTAIRDIEFCL